MSTIKIDKDLTYLNRVDAFARGEKIGVGHFCSKRSNTGNCDCACSCGCMNVDLVGEQVNGNFVVRCVNCDAKIIVAGESRTVYFKCLHKQTDALLTELNNLQIAGITDSRLGKGYEQRLFERVIKYSQIIHYFQAGECCLTCGKSRGKFYRRGLCQTCRETEMEFNLKTIVEDTCVERTCTKLINALELVGSRRIRTRQRAELRGALIEFVDAIVLSRIERHHRDSKTTP